MVLPGDSSPNALDDLNRHFRRPLIAFFMKRVKSRAEAEDLTQEAFLRLAAHPDRQNGEALHSYVFTIASNLIRDRERKYRWRRMAHHAPLDERTSNSSPQLIEGRDPERVLLAKEALQEVMIALGEMNEKTREIFILSRLENLDQKEIGALYGISVSAVQKHILRALAQLGVRNMYS